MKTPNAETIFNEALAIRSDEERLRYLRGACGGDVYLFAKVERLIQAQERSGEFLPTEPGDSPTVLAATPLSEGPGTRIGRYKLLQQIGEGGMGVVYMAEQQQPVHRRVALKIIKLGMDTKQVVARFEAERQALALMDHPNIAKVLDGGATDTGRPYFVMELVQGVPITEFCDKAKLSAKGRLKLFIQVCQAIQHAHQKGIIHRDIKPSNVMVTLHDGVPVPKVIDFGIAKATNQKLTEKTLFTNFATMIGTPAYMSPEQAELSGLDIDTRTDIYALGVLLYALLTGTTPFPEKRLLSLGYGEMQRVILEEEPERPSTRLSTMANEQKTVVARNCGEDLASLSNLLKGDLDWIVMKCLEKDRQRRYETANGLASDIQRHLTNEPVSARPPSAGYRFQKMIRRNQTAAWATAAVAVTLVAALGLSTVALVRERQARRKAVEAEHATQAESIRADSVANFVIRFIDSVVPDLSSRGQHESIKRLLEVADRLALELTNAPLAEARVRFAVAKGYSDGLLDDRWAFPIYQSVEALTSKLGLMGETLANLARMRTIGSAMWNEVDRKRAIELEEFGQAALKRTPPDFYGAAFGLMCAAEFFMEAGSFEEAERLAQQGARAAVGTPDQAWYEGRALYYLVQIADARGIRKETEEAADKYFAFLRTLASTASSSAGETVRQELNNLWISDWSLFPKTSLEKALGAFPTNESPERNMLQGLLGVAQARNGDWQGGMNTLRMVANDPSLPPALFGAGLGLAAIQGDVELQRTLAHSGVARFASSADGASSGAIMVQLLLLPPDPALLPTITNLMARSQEVPTYLRAEAKLTLAFYQYRMGQFREAAQSVNQCLSENRTVLARGQNNLLAKAWFLRAAVFGKQGNVAAACEAYLQGLKIHPENLIRAGTAYSGYRWPDAVMTERIRREAAAVLGDATPHDAPSPGKP